MYPVKAHFYFSEKSDKPVLCAAIFSYTFRSNIIQSFSIINDINISIPQSWEYSKFLKKHNPALTFLKEFAEAGLSTDRNILRHYLTVDSSFSSSLAEGYQ